jgi:hypothetical protein
MADKNADQEREERIILLSRLWDRKDAILKASHAIEDLRYDYIANGRNDTGGKIEVELFKQVYSILSSLSELAAYGASSTLISIITNFTANYPRLAHYSQSPDKYLHLAETKTLGALCTAANSVMIKWDLKRGPVISIDKLESVIQIFKVIGSTPV